MSATDASTLVRYLEWRLERYPTSEQYLYIDELRTILAHVADLTARLAEAESTLDLYRVPPVQSGVLIATPPRSDRQ